MAATVGVIRWVLHLRGCQSLKMKRSVVRGLRDRLQARLSVSAAETDLQDRRQMAELCAAVVSGERRMAEKVLNQADGLVRSELRADVVESEIAYF